MRYDLDNELYSIDIHIEMSTSQNEPFMLPKHCEQNFFISICLTKIIVVFIPCTPKGDGSLYLLQLLH
jgi:hypothetical protein